ncbi:MAG: FtsX-like permease family protein, partial [bacterium]|nr:FtsX-like permease family protein [bacterium]
MRKPPKIAESLIKICQNNDDSYQSLGDFEEVFNVMIEEYGAIKAYIWYWAQLFKSIPEFFETSIFWGFTMFKSYLKIAYRNLLRNKVYSVINVAGLSIGLACTILITFYIQFEQSYDEYHENADRIYRINNETWTGVSLPYIRTIEEEVPEIEAAVMTDYTSRGNKRLFSYGQNNYYETEFYMADPAFFKVFDHEFIYGDPETALIDPRSIVLTEKVSKKFFGDENPVGRILTYEKNMDFVITGVIKNVPKNSHLIFDLIGSFKNVKNIYTWMTDDAWGSMNYQSYIMLKDNTFKETVENKINAIYMEHRANSPRHFSLHSVTDIHLHPQPRGEYGRRGNILYIYYYLAITFVILLVAIINFTNLATAHSLKRAREVGLKKVFGARKNQLIKQFMGEAILISCISVPAGIILSKFFYPFFKEITGLPVDLRIMDDLLLILLLIGVAFGAGVISGSYPGFFASSLRPVKIFRQKIITQTKGMSLRNVLLLGQFSITVFAIS